MTAGTPYFAWIDPTETTFTDSHKRWDEQIFSFKLLQDEGDPAALTLVVRRPGAPGPPIGLLGPGRKIWCWFALDCDGTNLIKFRGRLVGVPTDLFQELVTLDFIARPIDVVAQKQALAVSLAVLPYYDPALIDPTRRITATGGDPDAVLEGYSAIWHYDRETHVITISDEIVGEDGTVSFDASNAPNTVLYDGLGLNLTTGPLAKASVSATFNWTQHATGVVDLSQYIVSRWNQIQLDAGSWFKPGSSLGNGWVATNAFAANSRDFTVRTKSFSSQVTTIFPDGDRVTGSTTESTSECSSELLGVQTVVTKDEAHWVSQPDPETAIPDLDGMLGGLSGTYVASFNQEYESVSVNIGIQVLGGIQLIAGFGEGRQMGERVSISLTADVQPILTDPADGETLQLQDINSVNLSEAIDGDVPMGDSARPSYVATGRGIQSIEYLILLLRATLLKRARVVEITFAPRLARMPEITLRKNSFLVEPRIGEATGKFIGYSIELDGADGRIKCAAKIGCTIGRGGTVTAQAGTATYADAAYAGADYQQFAGQTVAVGGNVTFSPPVFVPTPGSINFLSGNLTPADVIDTDLIIERGTQLVSSFPAVAPSQDALQTATNYVTQRVIPTFETQAKFKLKDVSSDVIADYTIDTSTLVIPTGYNLEAA